MMRWLAALACAILCAGCALFGTRGPSGVELVFAGNRNVPDSELATSVGFVFDDFEHAAHPLAVVDDAAYELELTYRGLGYPNVRVEGRLDTSKRPPRARFTIEEGPRVEIRSIEFPGAPERDREELRRIFLGEDVDASVHWLREGELRTGQRAIEAWYRQRGHAQGKVGDPVLAWNTERTSVGISVAVQPGPVYRLAEVRLEFPEESGLEAGKFESAWRARIGEPFDERQARALRGRITEALEERGYPDAAVEEAGRELADGAARLRFSAVPGPRVRIGRILYDGNELTRASFLDARVELEPGAWYTRSAARTSLANLQRSGIFDRTTLSLAPAEEPGAREEVRDVEVSLTESRAVEVFFEPGYGSYEELRLSAGVRHRNLFGTGRTLDLSSSVSRRAQRVDLSLIDPWILGNRSSTSLTLFSNRRQEPSFFLDEKGVELATTWRLNQALRLRAGWQYSRSDVSDVQPTAPLLDQDVGISQVSLAPSWDTRDAFNDPRRGSLSSLRFDLASSALGSQLEFVRLNLLHSHFLPLGRNTVLALSGDVGWIMPIGATDEIPIQERYFNGGENSVRSFLESQLGPKDASGDPLGGEAETTFTIELRQHFTSRFQGALFVDAGTVELRHADVFQFTDPRYGIGAGLRYMLPIGPIRLDGALNPDPHPDEAQGAVHLSVGFSF